MLTSNLGMTYCNPPSPADASADSWFDVLQRGGDVLPPALRTLGFELVSASRDPGRVEAQFVGRPEFANLLGGMQGGFLAAMLDGSLSCALLASMPAGHFAPTLEMTINYLQVAPVGPLLVAAASCAAAGRSPSWPASCAPPTARSSPRRRRWPG